MSQQGTQGGAGGEITEPHDIWDDVTQAGIKDWGLDWKRRSLSFLELSASTGGDAIHPVDGVFMEAK